MKKIANYALMSAISLTIFTGCEKVEDKPKGALVIIKEIKPGEYKIEEEFPSSENKVILKDYNGTERILSKDEMDKLLAKENEKIENGSSNLTNGNLGSGGLSLGEAILSSAVGAAVGSWIGNKLFNSPNFNQNRQNAYKNPSAFSRSINEFKNCRKTITGKEICEPRNSSSRSSYSRGSFFNSKSTSSSRKSGFFSSGSSFFGG